MTNPLIKSVSLRTALVPLPIPHQTASGIIQASPLVLIDITTNQGVIGHSIVFTYTPVALKPVATFIDNLQEMLVGQPLAPLSIARQMAVKFRLMGTQGLAGMALAGIDMALWDALARGQNKTLAESLGAELEPVKAYAGIGFDGESGCARAAEEFAVEGFKAVKAKIGYATVAEDVRIIRAMRRAVGEEVQIMVDYNQSLSVDEAICRLRHLDQEGLAWVEEPTLAHDFSGHAEITRQSATPIQCGENWWGPLDMRHGIDARASDLVMPDVMKIGGVTGWVQAAGLAHANGMQVSSHLWPEVSAQLLCATPTAHWLEYADWWNPILAEPLKIDNGMALIEDRPGSGIEWNEQAISQYLV